jgi:hypothetical protein
MTPQTIIVTTNQSRAIATHVIYAAPDGSVVTIKPPKRSLPQNAKFHAMISDVSRAKPGGRNHTPDTWKALILHACGHAVQFENGLNGQPFPIGFKSSRLSKSEMADAITFLQQWGDDNGVKWTNE